MAVAFVVAGVCMASLTAYAQTFSVSGTVTLTASQTLPKNRPNACATVTLTRFNGNTGLANNTINTDAEGNGTYSFTGLPAGDFTVSAYAYELTAPRYLHPVPNGGDVQGVHPEILRRDGLFPSGDVGCRRGGLFHLECDASEPDG